LKEVMGFLSVCVRVTPDCLQILAASGYSARGAWPQFVCVQSVRARRGTLALFLPHKTVSFFLGFLLLAWQYLCTIYMSSILYV